MSDNNEYKVRVPSTLTIRDLIYITIVVVSVTTSFLLYGTRLSVIEQEMLHLGSDIIELKVDIKDEIRSNNDKHSNIRSALVELQKRQREIEARQARIEWDVENLKVGKDNGEG